MIRVLFACMNGYQIIHNYIRPHEGLNGKTSAEACRIEVKGKNNACIVVCGQNPHLS
jgi:hypothetical protein